ncbi:MAG: hypothetical protein A2499_01115 [Stygiobacter sp. RIFOXYC12_FULL_38_8]|nr:MAG: hypothetical protein A2X62_06575 [Stygiobacter sp. GWC2_38_9]OGV06142.1 MAG: hypothetical protein A2299_08035 [Stygiobacter sp. RIFOXYB2_FULL_37_11]OGV11381.1 MAG: hypothetical protein A2237_10770 [Stygiobacter sp. RIFOXYA2_FULL_38_8]OGV16793.1 MAG: hypothetical protein A2440_05480 [Stygiobacter sp. RIFOXYC2_FULL_38_25]OGV29418.1 MAG: hypothetical protein A2499_01115 [Stygiobacter sp. RIFOXYC12_FULL_38_8]OGV82856.1 MAG: hypothetical protein A2X65_12675 [Stygiobacter sp. GWF2_38_21]RJQ
MKYSIVLILLFIVGCASAIYSSKEEKLYVEKCGGCHRVYAKDEFSKEHWLKEFDEMTKRAKLDEAQKMMMRNYLFDEGTANPPLSN